MFVTSFDTSFMNNTNNVGPNTVSCGMLLFTAPHFESTPSIQTFCLLLWRNGFIQRNRFPDVPNASILTAKRSCGTVSKALAKSL